MPDAYQGHIERILMNIKNGNLSWAAELVMDEREGEPVLVVLDVVKELISDKIEMSWHTEQEINRVFKQFIKIMSIWLDR